jgi:hypothetical protein
VLTAPPSCSATARSPLPACAKRGGIRRGPTDAAFRGWAQLPRRRPHAAGDARWFGFGVHGARPVVVGYRLCDAAEPGEAEDFSAEVVAEQEVQSPAGELPVP